MNLPLKRTLLVVFIVILGACITWAGPQAHRKPTKADKCPVCGMFVYKYPDFTAQVIFQDGTVYYFDGTKDMFKYIFSPHKYTPDKKDYGIISIYVTEYYRVTPLDALKAFYVTGSDVYGPMGRELIPFEKKADAEEFLQDHRGKAIFRYQDITPSIIKGLD